MAGFTAIAAGVSLAATAATTAKSFSDASKQKRLQQEAEKKAEESMKAARAKLEVNYMDALGIAKEPYELEREQMRAAGAQATSAAAEGEQRGVGATAGRVMAAEQMGQEKIRTEMAKDMYELEKASAKEEGRLRDIGVKLDLDEVEGAQAAAAQAEQFRAQHIQQGIQGAISTVQQGMSFIPLYQQNIGAQKDAVASMGDEALKPYGTTQADIQGMSNTKFRQFKSGLDAKQRNTLFTNPAYIKGYEDPWSAFYGFAGYNDSNTNSSNTTTKSD